MLRPLHLLFTAFLLFIITFGCFAQKTEQHPTAVYLDSNGTMDQYAYAYDELLKMMERQYPKTEANTQGWAYLVGNKTEALAAMKALLVPIYDSHFTSDEIKEMTRFYQSDTGKQLIGDRSKMTEEQKKELNDFYNSAVGAKIVEKQSLLSAEISKASENWSRELYETALSLLKDG